MKNEAEVWASVKRELPGYVMARRIEDSSGALGTWDVWIGWNQRSGWLELKHTNGPGERPKLRPGQAAFGADLISAMVPGLYLVGDRQGTVRVLSRGYDGEDWRKSLMSHYKIWDKYAMNDVLDLMGWR